MYIILVAIMKIVAYVPAYNELLQMSVQYTYYRYSTARHPDLPQTPGPLPFIDLIWIQDLEFFFVSRNKNKKLSDFDGFILFFDFSGRVGTRTLFLLLSRKVSTAG